MPHNTPEKRRAYLARPEVRERQQERDRLRYRSEKRQAWIAKFSRTPEFKAANYGHVKAWRERPENKPKRAEEARKWRIAHRDTWDAIKQRHRQAHLDEIRLREAAAAKKRRAADPEGEKRRRSAFAARRKARQEAIAGRPMPEICDVCGENHLRIVFDHCHRQGHFRGWLCDRCNKVLGMVKDDAKLLVQLAGYLGSAPAIIPLP